MNITEYLIVDPEHKLGSQTEVRYKTLIKKVKENQFYIPFGDKPTHWQLRIEIETRWTDEPSKFESTGDYVLFHWTGYGLKPTIEKFSEHIYNECRNTLQAMNLHEPEFVSDVNKWAIERDEITPAMVYKFMKLNHLNYTQTEDFLKHYDIYLERIFHNMKFMVKLVQGSYGPWRQSFEIPIGENFLAFLNLKTIKFWRTYEFA